MKKAFADSRVAPAPKDAECESGDAESIWSTAGASPATMALTSSRSDRSESNLDSPTTPPSRARDRFSRRRLPLDRGQRLVQVVDEVFFVLEADGEADAALGDAHFLALLRGNGAVRGGGRMGRE